MHEDNVLDLVVALAGRQLLESAPGEQVQRTQHLRTTPTKAFERGLELGPFVPYEGWYEGPASWTGGVIHFRELHDQWMKSWTAQLGRDYAGLDPLKVSLPVSLETPRPCPGPTPTARRSAPSP